MARFYVVVGLLLAMGGLAIADETDSFKGTVITSKRLSFDYRRFIAVFEENVVVVDPEVRMESDRLNVLFEGSNEVKSVTATGNVKLWHEDKTASCNRAIYVSRTGEVFLHGDARLQRGNDTVMGDEITFNLNNDRMTCTPGRLVIFPDDKAGSGDAPSRLRSLGPSSRTEAQPGAREPTKRYAKHP